MSRTAILALLAGLTLASTTAPAGGPAPSPSPSPSKAPAAGAASPAPSFTDEDLKRYHPASPSPSPGPKGKAPSPRASAPAAVDDVEGVATPPPKDKGQDERMWRMRAAAARKAIKDGEARVADIQARIDALRMDLSPTNLSDPNREQTRQAQIAAAMEDLD